MRFGLLGSLEVVDDQERHIDIGGGQPRTLLALLLVAGGRVVTADRIIDVLWGDSPPASANGTLQSYVSRLRRDLEPGRGKGTQPTVLLFEPPGYRLAIGPDDLDITRFEALADAGAAALAAGRASEAVETLTEAEALWRGAALVEFRDHEFGRGIAQRLEERRLAALEDRVAAGFALGDHAALVGELRELVAEHPLREGLHEQLARALYRTGRQADALRALDAARTSLRDELGLEPGPALRELESAILAHDPSLDPAAPLKVAEPPPPVAPADIPAPAPAATTLVGRHTEMAELRTVLDEAATGLRVAIIEGEPGIGKTRLTEELTAEAAPHATVLWGRAYEGGAAPAFWPWLPPLRALVAGLPAGEVGAHPTVTRLLQSTDGDGSEPPEANRFVLFEAVAALLERAAAQRPIVLVLDDLQWADVTSLELLTSVLGRLASSPLLIVGTVRELPVGQHDAVVETLAELTRQRGTRRIRLAGLARSDVAALVHQTTGDLARAEDIVAIYDRSEGNPFFTTELARLLVAGTDATDVPSGVRDTVRRRLGLLPEPTLDLLRVAAIIGRDADLEVLTRAADRSLDECLDDLEPALVNRLLLSLDDQPGTYRFAHALVREAVVEDLSPLKRARLHLRVADAYEPSDDTAEIVAEHLWKAAPIGVGRRAADALERAASVAVRRLAYGSALDLAERAVQLRRAAGTGPEDVQAEIRAITIFVAVSGAHSGYPSVIGSPTLARGRMLAEESGNTAALVHLLWAEWAGLDQANQFPRSHPIAVELIGVVETTDSQLMRLLAHTAYGISNWHVGRLVESGEHLDIAASVSRQVVPAQLPTLVLDTDQVFLAIPFSTYIRDLRGLLDDPDAAYEEIVRLFPGNPYWEQLVMDFCASAALATGDVDRAVRAGRRGTDAVPLEVSFFWGLQAQAYLGAALCLHGRADEGAPLIDDAWSRYTERGIRTNGVTFLAWKARGLALAGRIDEAAAALAEAQDELATYQEWLAEPQIHLAEAALRQARGDEVAEVVDALELARAKALEQGASAVAAQVDRLLASVSS